MAKHRLTAEDIEDIKDMECKDPFLLHKISQYEVAGEFDEDYG